MPAIPAVLPNPRAGTPIQRLQPKEVSNQGAAGPRAPWLIARGRSLEVPRLDRVALHHGSFGSDAAAARFARVLIELGIANPHDWKRCAGDPATATGEDIFGLTKVYDFHLKVSAKDFDRMQPSGGMRGPGGFRGGPGGPGGPPGGVDLLPLFVRGQLDLSPDQNKQVDDFH